MISIKHTAIALGTAMLLAGGAAQAQNADGGMAEAIMSLDGSASVGGGIAVATGWHVCSVARTGAGWGNHYVALTCPSGPSGLRTPSPFSSTSMIRRCLPVNSDPPPRTSATGYSVGFVPSRL